MATWRFQVWTSTTRGCNFGSSGPRRPGLVCQYTGRRQHCQGHGSRTHSLWFQVSHYNSTSVLALDDTPNMVEASGVEPVPSQVAQGCLPRYSINVSAHNIHGRNCRLTLRSRLTGCPSDAMCNQFSCLLPNYAPKALR